MPTIPPVVDDQLIATVWGNAVADAINHGGLYGTEAARPAGVPGMRYFATDTKREFLYDGTGWVVMAEPAQTYTPALTGITLGNGTLTGRYHRSDGWCDF